MSNINIIHSISHTNRVTMRQSTLVAIVTVATMVAMATGYTHSGAGSSERDQFRWTDDNLPVDNNEIIYSGDSRQTRQTHEDYRQTNEDYRQQNVDHRQQNVDHRQTNVDHRQNHRQTNGDYRIPWQRNDVRSRLDIDDVSRDTHGNSQGHSDDLGLSFGSGDDLGSGFNLDLDEMPQNMEGVMNILKYQVHAARNSQIKTRSILNIITERQDAFDQDVALLKDEIRQIKTQQIADHNQLQQLHATVSDFDWATADLKSNQNRMKHDITSLKEVQTEQNATVIQMEESSQLTFQGVQNELTSIRKQMKHDRHVLHHLSRVARKDVPRQSVVAIHEPKPTRETKDTAQFNRIPLVSYEDLNNIDQSGSGGGASRVDTAASSIEERDNTVGYDLKRLMHKEQIMRREVDGFQRKFKRHDAELSRLYTMFYNVSLQLSSLENRLVTTQRARLEQEVNELQQNFMNFTKQMINYEQVQAQSKLHSNTTVHNKNDIADLIDLLENHQMRITTMEELVLENRHLSTQQIRGLHNQMEVLNETIQGISRKVAKHDLEAAKVVNDLSDRLVQVQLQLAQTTQRMLEMEVKVLNRTLGTCQKENRDVVQDQKISDFGLLVEDMGDKVGGYEHQITRMDRGISRLYSEVEKHSESIDTITQNTEAVIRIVPDLSVLKNEVSNLISHLPRDCNTALERASSTYSSTYLIKPSRSLSSVLAYCQSDQRDRSVWTVIQRRLDGTTSFAKTWVEYKNGFGSADREYWIGNDNLHYLTTQDDYQLRIDMWDLNNQYWFAEYDFFKVDEESTYYRLHIDGYRGNATDALRYSNFMPFSTQDQDNDASSTHCAKFYTSGWWYKHCHYCNLNGRYTVGVVWFNQDSDQWVQMRRTVMKIRPLKESTNQIATEQIYNGNGQGSGETL